MQKKLEAGGFAFVPKGVQHDIYAYGDVALRLLSFFPSARVESIYTEILLPFDGHTLASDMPAPSDAAVEEIDFDDLPPGSPRLGRWARRTSRGARSRGRPARSDDGVAR